LSKNDKQAVSNFRSRLRQIQFYDRMADHIALAEGKSIDRWREMLALLPVGSSKGLCSEAAKIILANACNTSKTRVRVFVAFDGSTSRTRKISDLLEPA